MAARAAASRSSAVRVEPPASQWDFPPAETADEQGVVGIGADLEPGTVLRAYRSGMFPMPVFTGGPMGWWSPDPRGTIPLDGLRVTRSLRQSAKRYEVRVDTAFESVIDACRDPSREGAWITPEIKEAYGRLHAIGWVHSVECWSLETGELSGGLYGVSIGGFFAGESMFHRGRDASKVALVHLVELLASSSGQLLDVQWTTPHLRSMGAVDMSRYEYLDRLASATLVDTDPFG